jgi:hypothetical protein
VGVAALVVTPWVVRNAAVFGQPAPISSDGGVAFWIGHHDGATGHRESAQALREDFPGGLSVVAQEREANVRGYREGLDHVADEPLEELALVPKKLFWLFADDEEWMELNEAHAVEPFLAPPERDYFFTASNATYYALLVLAVTGALLLRGRTPPALRPLLLFAAYWVLASVVFYGDARDHTALMPLAAILASVALAALSQVAGRTVHGSAAVDTPDMRK